MIAHMLWRLRQTPRSRPDWDAQYSPVRMNAKTRWEHGVEGWRELDSCRRPWGAAHVGGGQRV